MPGSFYFKLRINLEISPSESLTWNCSSSVSVIVLVGLDATFAAVVGSRDGFLVRGGRHA